MGEYRGVEVFGRQRRVREAPRVRSRSRVGVFAAIAALVTGIATVTGIELAMHGTYEASILLAYLATGASVVALLCGVAAVLTGRGRAWGAVAVVVGVLCSPPVLTRLLAWASGLG